MDSVTLRPWPLKIPASSYGLLDELTRLEQTLKQRESELSTLEEEASQRGYKAGVALGYEAAMGQFTASLEAMAREKETIRQEFIEQLPPLAAALAVKILGQELRGDPTALISMVATLMAGQELGPHLTLELSERDFPWADSRKELLHERLDCLVTPIVNPSLAEGEVILSTPSARIEGTFEVFKKQIETLLCARSPRGETPDF